MCTSGPYVRHWPDLTVDDCRLGRQLADHLNQPREAPAEPRTAAAIEFDLIIELVDLDAKAITLDRVLPIVASCHRRGALRMAERMKWKNTS
jgi:hypothetical protein